MVERGVVDELRRLRQDAADRASGRKMAGTSVAWAAMELRLGLVIEQLDPAPRGKKTEEPVKRERERCTALDLQGLHCRYAKFHVGGCEAGRG